MKPRRSAVMDTTMSSDQRRTLTTADLAASTERRDEVQRREENDLQRDTPPRVSSSQQQEGELAPLFEQRTAQEYRTRWSIVQQGFVDDPPQAVRQGDELVAQVIKNLAETFAKQRATLEGEQGSTEELRLALRRYRSFFERLLTI